jgi:hypothetical protein
VRGYTPAAPDREVLEMRELVRVRAMRGTVYLMPKALVPHALAISLIKSIAEYAGWRASLRRNTRSRRHRGGRRGRAAHLERDSRSAGGAAPTAPACR